MKRKKTKKKHRHVKLTVLLIVVLLLALSVLMIWKLFVVSEVDVDGSSIYTDEQIAEYVLDDEYSWSSLYVYFKYKFREQDKIPFIDRMEISLEDPWTLHVQVVEKDILGYVIDSSTNQYVYFDQNGIVEEISPELIGNIMGIAGVSGEGAVVDQKLNIGIETAFSTISSLKQLLDKYEMQPENIYIDGNAIILSYGQIQVNIGGGDNLSDKIIRMAQIYPDLEGLSGTLHLESWDENSTDVHFRKGELTEIP